MPISELTNHQLSYFIRMADSGHGLNQDTLWLFWGAREHYRIPADERGAYYKAWKLEPLLVNKMKAYIVNKDPKEFLKFSIQQDIRDRSQVFIHKEVMEIFNTPAEFRKLVAENPELDINIKLEYLELLDKLIEIDFKQYVHLELKTELYKPEQG